MSTITSDTLKYVRRQEDTGVPRELATAFIAVQQETLSEASVIQLSTHIDINRQKHEVTLLRTELNAKFTLLQWMLGILLAGVLSQVLKSFF